MTDRPPPLRISDARRDLHDAKFPLLVLGVTAVVLTLVEYLFLPDAFLRLFPAATRTYAPGIAYGSWANVPEGTTAPWWGVLLPWAWWVGGVLALWVFLPVAVARTNGLRPGELGLGVRGLLPKLWIYGVLYALVFAGVWWASIQEGFTRTYPMLKPWYGETWSWGLLLTWWALYATQFFAVEFFFRGWMLFSLEKRFGMAAVAVMTVPYCMIHYHKPLPEALGAIVAGVVLGWLALRTRSIWGGWLVHVAVAITMDVMALLQGSVGLPNRFLP